MKRKPYVKTDTDNLSINEAIGIAGISRPTLNKWMKQNRFKFSRNYNRYILIDKKSFFEYLDELKSKGLGGNDV